MKAIRVEKFGDPGETISRDADIRGISLMHADDAELARIHAFILAGLDNRTLRPVIGKEMPLKDAAQAHVAVMDSGAYGKIVLLP